MRRAWFAPRHRLCYAGTLSDHRGQRDVLFDLRRGVALARKGDNQRAIASYTSAVQFDPKNAPAYFNRGAAHERLGDRTQAATDFAKARQLDPSLR